MCFGFLYCVCGLISLSQWLFFQFLICSVVQVLLLCLVVNLYFSIAIFLLLPLGQDLFSDAYLNKFIVCVVSSMSTKSE
jgi:hypothetical protein